MIETKLFLEAPAPTPTPGETPVNRAPQKCGCKTEKAGNTTVIFLDRVLITAFIIWLFIFLIKKIVE